MVIGNSRWPFFIGVGMCSVENCERRVHSKGLCQPHYRQQKRREQDPEVGTRKPGPKPTGVPSHKRMTDAERAAKKAAKTHCVNGHELTPENTYFTAAGQKICRICQRNSHQKYYGRPIGGDEPVGAHNRDKTHCKQGHEFTEQNTRITKDGARACRKCHAWSTIKGLYGITREQFDAMLWAQNGQCDICRETFDLDLPRQIHIDHDHVSGAVRGLLCGGCNPGLGNFKDNPTYLRAAADYLEKH